MARNKRGAAACVGIAPQADTLGFERPGEDHRCSIRHRGARHGYLTPVPRLLYLSG